MTSSIPAFKARTIGRSSLQLGCLAALVAASCHQQPKDFRIELPDVTFVVERDWVPPHIRAQAISSFEINVPTSRLPTGLLDIFLGWQKAAYGDATRPTTYRFEFAYEPTPSGFAGVQKGPGWSLLPDGTKDGYRVAMEPNDRPGSAGPRLWYELKSDPRFVFRCGAIVDGRDNGRVVEGCSGNVPYRRFEDGKCTQISISFPKREFDRWPALAEQYRAALRQFEAAPRVEKQGS